MIIIPNFFMESHNPFHGSSHHQPELLFQSLTIINHRLTIINHQFHGSKPPDQDFKLPVVTCTSLWLGSSGLSHWASASISESHIFAELRLLLVPSGYD